MPPRAGITPTLHNRHTALKLSVIIVSYNVRYYLEQCLHALFKATTGISTEVFVVDNHSSDGSVEYLSERFHDINFISSNHNLGFARANNTAIRQCHGEYVLLLNPDTIVGEHTLSDVISLMDSKPSAGCAGVRMIKTDGTDAMESRRGLPTPTTAFFKMCGLCTRYPHNRRVGRYYMGWLPWDKPARIEVVSGAFCMLRHSALDKVGLLDEDFFMYGEDIDLSYRMLKGGFDNWYVPSRILHYKGESTQKTTFRYVHIFYNAMLIFFRKHYGHMSLLLTMPIKAAIVAKAVAALLRTQLIQTGHAMGLTSYKRRKEPLYVFITSQANSDACRRIAARKGIRACFHCADNLPEGHTQLHLEPDTCTYVVYDVDAFSYERIFELSAKGGNDNISIGTFNKDTGIIITGDEILK